MAKKVVALQPKEDKRPRNGVYKGTPLHYPQWIADDYYKKLEPSIDKMIESITKKVIAELNRNGEEYINKTTVVVKDGLTSDASLSAQIDIILNKELSRWQLWFNRKAPSWAKMFIRKSNKTSATATHASLKDLSGYSIPTSSITPGMKESIRSSISENVDLIKSIPAQYFKQIKNDINSQFTGSPVGGLGDLIDSIESKLENRKGQTYRRARNIAIDQVSKVYQDLNISRLKNAGVEEFEWLHLGGSKQPRHLHKYVLNGNIYRFDDPPIIDKNTGIRGFPGQLNHCKCGIRPIIKV